MISVLLVTPGGDVPYKLAEAERGGGQPNACGSASDEACEARVSYTQPGEGPSAAAPSASPVNVRLLVRELTMLEVERALILHYLDRCGGSQRRAAVAMGVPRSTLNDRVRRLGLVATGLEVKP